MAAHPVKRSVKRAAPPSAGRSRSAAAPGKPSVQYSQNGEWQVIDVIDGIAVSDTAFKTVHYLNHTAAMVFLLCKQPIGLDVLCAVFREEFGLKTAPRAELQGILAAMEKAGLVRAVPPDAAAAPARKPKQG